MKILFCIFAITFIMFDALIVENSAQRGGGGGGGSGGGGGGGFGRGGPPEMKFDSTKCCNVETSEAQTQFQENMQQLASECAIEKGNKKCSKNFHQNNKRVKIIAKFISDDSGPPKISCFLECLGNKTNIVRILRFFII